MVSHSSKHSSLCRREDGVRGPLTGYYYYDSVVLYECPHPCLFLGGFHGNGSFCLGEDPEVEPEVQDDFLSFEADLVAEQLTYMDAVSEGAALARKVASTTLC